MRGNRTFRSRPRRFSRRGQALVEFGIIAMILSMLVAAMVSFGLLLCKANVAQQAADVGAQELARLPLSPVNAIAPAGGDDNDYLDQLLYSPNTSDANVSAVRSQIFDEKYLYVPVADVANQSLFSYSSTWPLLNRLLVPAMVYDSDLNAYRYPGAVVKNLTTGNTTVLVPLVSARDPKTGVETIELHHPVEEVKFYDQSAGTAAGQFSVAATFSGSSAVAFSPGVCALRVYCPVQTPMVGFQSQDPDNFPPQPNVGDPVAADDAGVTVTDPYNTGIMQSYALLAPAGSNPGSTESGEYGMGSFYFSAVPLTYQVRGLGLVRPYRKVVVGQGVYRREVFGP